MKKIIKSLVSIGLVFSLLFVSREKAFAVTNVNDTTSLKAAIAANEDVNITSNFTLTETVNVPATYTGTINGGNNTITSTNNLKLMFSVAKRLNVTDLNLDANGQGRIFDVRSAELIVTNGSLKNGLSYKDGVADVNAQVEGGAIYANDATLSFTGTKFENNRSVKPASNTNTQTRPHGGAIYAYRSTVNFTNITAINNASGSNAGGGLIFADLNSTLNVTGSTFEGNNSTDGSWASKGGTISIYQDSVLNSTNNTYSTGRGFNHGGALYAHNATINSTNDTFIIPNLGDAYGISGGSIGISSGTLNLDGGTFKTTATSFTKVIHAGGYIASSGANQNITIKNSTFTGRGKGQSMSTFGGAIALEDTGGNVVIENTTITETTADETGGAITISTRHGQSSNYNVTLRNVNISNTSSWNYGGAIYAGPDNTLNIEGGSIQNTNSGKGGAIYNDARTSISNGNTITSTSARQLGGGIYNNGYLKLDEMTLDANAIAQYPGVAAELAGSNIYAAKDVIITPNATISADKDVRVIDNTSKILLTGALTKNIYVSVSEVKKANTVEANAERLIGYTVAAGTDNYVATKEDAKKLHYISKPGADLYAQPVSEIDDHTSIGKWDYVLNPENNTVVLGQRAKLVYHANTGEFAGANNETEHEDVVEVYKASQTGFTKNDTLNPTKEGGRFVDWYKENVKSNVELMSNENAENANKFDFENAVVSGNGPITTILNPNEFHVYAGYVRYYKITHEFVKEANEPATLPTEISERVNGKDLTNLVDGSTNTPNSTINTQPYEDTENDGTWKFVQWDQPSITINKVDGKFIGTWRFEANLYKVTHEFIKNPSVTIALPQEIKDRVNGKDILNLRHKATAQVNTTISIDDYADAENDGVWTFEEWDKEVLTINKADGKFIGTWTFTPNIYVVTHEFVKNPAVTIALPQEIADRVNGHDYTELVNNTTVSPKQEISTESYADEENDGIWTFEEWDNESITINKANGKFIGTWTFTPNKYVVTHQFKKEDYVEFDLPQEIANRVNGHDYTELVNNTTVSPKQEIDTEAYVDVENDGVWTFVQWDKETHTIEKTNGEFIGTWTFTPNKYVVTHEFVKRDDVTVDLPEAIRTRTKDADLTDLVNKTQVEPNEIIDKSDYVDEENDGVWTFEEWDSLLITINKANGKFVGIWNFVPNVYRVTHRFEKAEGVQVELPEEISDRVNGRDLECLINKQTVSPEAEIDLTEYVDEVNDGVWTFVAWDKETHTIAKADGEFVGVWTFKKNEKPIQPKPIQPKPSQPKQPKPPVQTNDSTLAMLLLFVMAALGMVVSRKK